MFAQDVPCISRLDCGKRGCGIRATVWVTPPPPCREGRDVDGQSQTKKDLLFGRSFFVARGCDIRDGSPTSFQIFDSRRGIGFEGCGWGGWGGWGAGIPACDVGPRTYRPPWISAFRFSWCRSRDVPTSLDFRFPLSAFRFPLSAFRFPLSAFRFPFSAFRGLFSR